MSPYSEIAREQGGGWERRETENEHGRKVTRTPCYHIWNLKFIFRQKVIKDSVPMLPPKTFRTYQNSKVETSLKEDFQVISESYLLSSVNLKSNPCLSPPISAPAHKHESIKSKNSRENPTYSATNCEKLFNPGCGHKECIHCESEVKSRSKRKETQAT